MMGNFLHRIPLWGRYFVCLCASFVLLGFVSAFLPHFSAFDDSKKAPLLFEKPDFQSQPHQNPDAVSPANKGYQIEHTSRGVIRFQTETAGSPAFGTPVPEILPYDPRSKLER
ncbi:hypothetical protein FAI41_04370 [Acetobacteraceae bacterium]|nr:hypothetical protein FAI41_04370 [Acetobacteraceae bacterium]